MKSDVPILPPLKWFETVIATYEPGRYSLADTLRGMLKVWQEHEQRMAAFRDATITGWRDE